jgi:hypothetical protein
MSAAPESHPWWASLRHGGFLLDEKRLSEHFPQAPQRDLSSWALEQLRGALTDLAASPDETDARTRVLTVLLEVACGLDGTSGGTWNRRLDATWTNRSITGEAVKPAHVWDGPLGRRLPVFTTPEPRLGVGHGRRAVARVLEWLRARNEPLAVLSNGHQLRLIWASADTHAWCESDAALWLVEGRAGLQIDALRILLSPASLTPVEDTTGRKLSPLLRGIVDSRKGQAELSAMLGERVRTAVERLIQSHGPFLNALEHPPAPADTYVAACRVMMRLVFGFFAEARDLLPRSHSAYFAGYSLAGLLAELDRSAGSGKAERLAHRYCAWPRLLALFRLIYFGSPHPELPLLAYGGTLFAPGEKDSADGISRAIWVFENACFDAQHPTMPDREVWEILQLLTRTRVPIRQGRGRALVTVPVDFSDLSSEYIGILYEGLLDYELRSVGEAEGAVLFLAIGNEPALPLARLEGMDDPALKGLFEAFKKAAKEAAGGEEEADEEESESGDAEAAEETDPLAEEVETAEVVAESEPAEAQPAREAAMQRAHTWARKGAEKAGLVKRPRARGGAAALEYERNLDTAARLLVRRLILPGEWYLVRWGGTRKGAGTFYTRPGLSLPTIRRALEPLCYTIADGMLRPKSPEIILALKVCDPACGSGTFPVGALRYLTDALFAAVFEHGWLEFANELQADGSFREVIRPKEQANQPASPIRDRLLAEVRLRAIDDEARLRAYLKRLVVENCLYGVDLDPLAIELARLALWVETMDPRLPFGFLDHKFRCGNGLVGAWLDTFQHYPVMAWKREGGDKAHKNGVHFQKEAATRALKTHLDTVITPALREFIEQEIAPGFAFVDTVLEPSEVFDRLRVRLDEIHTLSSEPDLQAEKYRSLRDDDAFQKARAALDLWCALWFWPFDRLAEAPTPLDFSQPSAEALQIATELRRLHRFFHWELEFPDVFSPERRADHPHAGFDALLGNPPWEIQKPNSMEWFSNVDPLYRAYGKTEAVQKQTAFFADRAVEAGWIAYNAHLKALSTFTKFSAFAFGDPAAHGNKTFHHSLSRSGAESLALHARWCPRRSALFASNADPAHPFRYQGSADINTYKLFAEQSLALLRPGGRLGFILPSGIYSDKGSSSLRGVFLDTCHWEWCFGFENREGIFDIHRAFKFGAVIVRKGGRTITIRTAFMRRHVGDWEQADSFALDYARELVDKLSPFSRALVEIRGPQDVALLDRMYSRGVLLGDQTPRGWGLRYGTEFHMTNDSRLFPPLPKWEVQGFRPDEYGHWLRGPWRPVADLGLQISDLDAWHRSPRLRAASAPDRPDLLLSRDGTEAIRIEEIKDVAVPLYEGRMIGQFDFSQKGWVSGKGRTAVWRDIPWDEKRIEPQFLISFRDAISNGAPLGKLRPGFMEITSATNQRTMIATAIGAFPCGHKVPLLSLPEHEVLSGLSFVGCLNTFVFDKQMRSRLGGLSITWALLEETTVPLPAATGLASSAHLARLAASLSLGVPLFAREWNLLRDRLGLTKGWQELWAITPHERLRLRCVLDACVAYSLGMSREDFTFILADCDHPVAEVSRDAFATKLDPKGFWRVDKEREPELRHPVLAQVAYADLQAQGLEAFLAGPDGTGWQLPATLRLADYALGHDARAREPQPVAARLGLRHLDWQLTRDPAASWAECAAHATKLEALWRHARTLTGVETTDLDSETAAPRRREPAPNPQTELF